ncbi:MAG: hypothetical protein RQ723_03885 [Desulfuromonadales bacterium]|nr:hypothetical protein [Desulfuromonadales bacterium]
MVLGGCYSTPLQTSGRATVHGDHGSVDIAFSDHDRTLIRNYYGGKTGSKKMPPGLAKKGKLPPGIQKQLQVRGHFPPGLQYQSLPADLDRQLTRLPDGYLRVLVGSSFVLFNEQTRVIFDLMQDFD